MTYTWDMIPIGEASYLLPAALEWTWAAPNADSWHIAVHFDSWHIAVHFKDHRHFESSSTITFHP